MSVPTATTAGRAAVRRDDQAMRACLVTAATIATVVFLAGVAVGAASFTPGAEPSGPGFALSGSGLAVLGQLLARNLGAALLLFSGYATFGITTLVGLVLTSVWVGAGSHAAVSTVGLGDVNPWALTYLPFELVGVVLAASAGLLPLAGTVLRLVGDTAGRTAHSSLALRLMALATALIVVGAVIELLVITAN